ncbi:RPS8, partial [Symbiodinium microadriaticum]
MGISRDSRHKHYKTGGRSNVSIKKRKYEMGRPATPCKLGNKRVRVVRCRGGNKKYRALRLDTGNYAWGSENVTKKVRILDVVYNATSNELVRTKTLLKNTVVQIDAHPFMQWYQKKYGMDLGKKKKGGEKKEEKKEEAEEHKSRHVIAKQKARAANQKLDLNLEEQFQSGRLLACIASRPGQCGRADGYVLEGEELSFYRACDGHKCLQSMASPTSPSYRSEFRALRQALLQLREEQGALLECLFDQRLLRPETFAASLHRRRFEAALLRAPCSFEATLRDVLEEPTHLAVQTARFAGHKGLQSLKATCRSLAEKLAGNAFALQDALTWFFVVGGSDHMEVRRSGERLDPSTGLWEALPAMQQRRFAASSAVLGGCLYVCGGSEQHGALNTAERFDPCTGLWEQLPAMTWPRIHAAALAAQGRLYLCGGHGPSSQSGQFESLSAVERFDPDREVWEALPELPQRRMAGTAAWLRGAVHIVGGSDGQEALSAMERLVENGFGPCWQALPPMSQPRFWATSAVLNDSLLVCSGNDGQQALLSTERFDPVACVWECLQPMLRRRTGAASAVLAGQLFLVGGHDEHGVHQTAEFYDSELGKWQEAAPMLQRRSGATATVLARCLLVCGGNDGSQVLNTVEVLDPVEHV